MVRAFLRSPTGLYGLVIIAAILLVAVLAPVFLSERADTIDVVNGYQGPSGAHWLGTDDLGRDLLARLLVATRLTLMLSIAAVALAAVLGITVGLFAASLRGRLRGLALRTIDGMQAFPGLIIAIYIGAVVGPGNLGPVLGIGLAASVAFARVSSSLAMSIGGRDFIQAARVTGIRGPALLFRYVLPNVAETLVITTTISIGAVIVGISGLSFLGLGVQAPDYDWGLLLSDGVKRIYQTPLAVVGPAVAIAVVTLAFGFFGEALARAINPQLAGRPARKRIPGLGRLLDPASAVVPAPRRGEPLLDVQDLRVVYPGPDGPLELVSGISFSVGVGERVGIVGESGSGKTMTAMAVADLISYPGQVTGRIVLDGREIGSLSKRARDAHLREQLAVVFQDPMSSLNPALSMGTQLTESSRQRGASSGTARSLAVTRLREVHMSAPELQLRRYPHELSGGMRQRGMIAMGLMNQPRLLIADEPTTALDVTIQAQIMDLLDEVRTNRDASLVLITHNLALVRQNCDRVLVMYAGEIVEDLRADELDQAKHPYTQALLAAIPDMHRSRNDPLVDIPGVVAPAGSRLEGCRYHPRCPLVEDRCTTDRPVLVGRADGHRVACWVANGGAS